MYICLELYLYIITFNIVTWNATGIMSSSAYLSTLLQSCDIDICGISEHWLLDRDQHFLNSIDSNYASYCISDRSLCMSNRSYGKGGVALMWKKQYSEYIVPLSLDDDRFIGIQLHMSDKGFMYFIQVYLPSSNNGIECFKEYIDKLNDIIYCYCNRGTLILMGDFNAHLQSSSFLKHDDCRSNLLSQFLQRNNYVAIDSLPLCTGAQSTFVSYDGCSESLIDHILSPIESLDLIESCEILDDSALNVSNHRPLLCSLRIPSNFCVPHVVSKHMPVNWNRVESTDIKNFQHSLSQELRNITLDEAALTKSNYQTLLDGFYQEICTAIYAASDRSLPKRQFKRFLKPYWNDHLKRLHYHMRKARHQWVMYGRPRDTLNVHYTEYKNCKREFRRYHRICSVNYLKHLNEELDSAAELDSGYFWKTINARKNRRHEGKSFEMKFNGITYRDPKDIAYNWGNYFSVLYSDVDNAFYDSDFRAHVDSCVNNLKQRQLDHVCFKPVLYRDVNTELKQLKKGKSCGPDSVYNEHLLYGGESFHVLLATLFSLMLKWSYVPAEMKRGNIITLYKGGRKRKDDPASYRAITLCSSLLKLYERILLSRINVESAIKFSPLQGGFQKGFSCTMSSFLLRECAYYAKQSNSKLFICFLDVKTAFDKVWHNGLFYKLHDMGLNALLWKAIVSLYENMESCLVYNGYKSERFCIEVGTRQGGVTSPFLYLCFIDKLLQDLDNIFKSFSIGNIHVPAIASADDMALLALTNSGLQRMMNYCFSYACKWRYQFNASKSAVIVCNETKSHFKNVHRNWYLGSDPVSECENYTHLGINFSKYLDLSENIKDANSKIRGTFLSLQSVGVGYENGLHPFTSRKIYRSVVLPKSLYGCEIWYNLTASDILYLERSHRFCLKYMQGITKRTRTDIARGLLKCYALASEIDKRKLTLFGQFCRLPVHSRAKDIFHVALGWK